MKEILKDARQTKLRRRIKDDLSDPMTTATEVGTRYKEDVDHIKDRFSDYDIEVREVATGYKIKVTHQMKTPLEKKCEELTKRLNGRRVHITNVVVAPRIVDERIGIKFDGLPGFPTRTGAISRSYFDAHTVEELAAAIEGLYFA